jgi:hypothetical protein
MTQEEFFYQCIDVIEHWLNGNRKLSDLREVTDKLYNEVTKPHWISVEDDGNPIDTDWYIFATGKIVENYCRTCKHRKRFSLNEYSNKVVQCCALQPSNRSNSGYKTIKVTDVACGFYEQKGGAQ